MRDEIGQYEATFGEAVKSPLTIARERKGLNMSQLARQAGTYPQHIERLEKIPGRLKRDWAIKLAPLLDVTPESLIFPEINGGEPVVSSGAPRAELAADGLDNLPPDSLSTLENNEELLVHFAVWALRSIGRESLALATDDQVTQWLRELVALYADHLADQQRILEFRRKAQSQVETHTVPPGRERERDRK